MNLILAVFAALGAAAGGPPAVHVAALAAVEPAARDTFSIDDPQPLLAPEAFDELARLWREQRYEGACVRGQVVRDGARGSVLYIERVSSAAHVEMCHGSKSVGAVVFVYGEQQSDSEVGQATARLLLDHPDWVVVGAVTGSDEFMRRDARGTIEPAASLTAHFSVWTRIALRT